MKKYVFNRMVLMLIVVATLCSMTGSAFAAGADDFAASTEMVSPRYATIREFFANLTISSSGKASCQVDADLYETYTGKITMYLINQSSGGQTVKSWSSNGAACNGSYYVSKGNTYQVKAVLRVYDSAGRLVESVPKFSNQVSF
ncbi:hypothetical protein [uncultured Oscillibacter sp.]|uniref:hypothetical protein n=1 Tax=uncultured Oscillibacter sp. TaxID=876091 RepID=UPI002614C8FA|nr:hypothetical protein [uncultured Oscillibacter sp.]